MMRQKNYRKRVEADWGTELDGSCRMVQFWRRLTPGGKTSGVSIPHRKNREAIENLEGKARWMKTAAMMKGDSVASIKAAEAHV